MNRENPAPSRRRIHKLLPTLPKSSRCFSVLDIRSAGRLRGANCMQLHYSCCATTLRSSFILWYLPCMPTPKLRAIILVLLLVIPAFAKQEKYSKAEPVQLTSDGNKWAEKTLKKMSLEEKIGQMIQIRAYADFLNVESDAYRQVSDAIKKYHLGSIILTVRISDGLLVKDLPYEAA